MADNDILVSEMTTASQVNTNDLVMLTQPDAQAETGYSTKKATALDVFNKFLDDTQYSTDLPDFTDKSIFGGMEELKGEIKKQAEDFIFATGTEDQLPYQLRPTPSNVGNKCMEKLVGVSCAFNQLVENPTNVISVTTINTSIKEVQNNIPFVAKHKYLVSYRQSATLTSNTRNTLCYVANSRKYQSALENRNLASGFYYWLFNCADTANEGSLEIWCNSPNVNVDFDLFNLIDLTAMFGSEVADYLYNLENS